MKEGDYYSIPAALVLLGGAGHIARLIGARSEALEEWGDCAVLDTWMDTLEPIHRRRLVAHAGRYGVVIISTPWLRGAVQFELVQTLRCWARFARRYPDATNMSLPFQLFAPAWRAWLRLRGQGHSIGRTSFASESALRARADAARLAEIEGRPPL